VLDRLAAAVRARPGGAVLACAAAAYADGLTGPFQFDDFAAVVDSPAARSLGAWWGAAGHGLRPLLQLTYAACSSAGLGPPGFHLVNLAVHLAATALVMAVAGAAVHPERRWPFAPRGAAELTAGLLFALHPIQTEAVTYVSGRSSSLMAVLYLAALLAYVQGVRARRPLLWAAAAPALWAAALLVKESAATLPLALLLWELCLERPRPRGLALRQGLFWALGAVALAAAILHPRYYALLYDTLGARPLPLALAYQVHGAAYLLSRLALLRPLSIDPGLGLAPPAPGLLAAEAAVVLALAGAGLALRRRSPAAAFGLAWLVLHLLLPYALVSRTDVVNERHAYLASVGLAVAAGALLARLAVVTTRPVLLHAGAALLSAGLLAATAVRNRDYASETALWERTALVSPANPRAHANLANAYERAGFLHRAREEYRRALELEPRYASARRKLGRVEEALGSPALPVAGTCAAPEEPGVRGPAPLLRDPW
jgi:protein O-mannosyl-transferase